MHPNFFTATALPSIFLILVLIIARLPKSSSDDNEQYVNCGQSFNCANIANIVYPFWGNDRHDYCGHPDFLLDCAGDVPSMTIGSRKYRVNAIDSSARVLTVARDDLWGNICPLYLYNTSLLTTFSYVAEDQDVTIYYGCGSPPPTLSAPNLFNCRVNTSFNTASYFVVGNAAFDVDLGLCSQRIAVKVNQTAGRNLALPTTSYVLLQSALESGFGLNWDANNTYCGQCVGSGGRCGYNYGSASFACYCADGPRDFTCNASQNENGSGGSGNNSLIVGLAVGGAVVAGIGLAWLTIFCRQRRKRIAAKFARIESKNASSLPSSKTVTVITPTTPSSKSGTDTESIPSYPSSKSDLLKASTYFGAQLFNYSELEEATDNFNSSRELGDGGFGTVYYGKLLDGRTVAVKRLYENNFKRVEQFMNEVEILTKLQHPNLVKLYGCTSKRSRELLLVYEYIPNGTVADHLHGKRANSGLLPWRVRLNIALETADALVYLHKSDVVHRDVKTNNILLDNDFHVKVADFGLSKLFPRDVTHVSTAPQGTPGYVDPEYYQCYQLTEKSDVYSFGVVLVELISSLQAVDTNRHRHDINLFNMAVNKIQNHALNELIDPSLGFEADSSVWRTAKMVAELAFRCLQQEKDVRPSMSEVLEALRGIHNENLNSQKAEVVEVVVEDVALLKNEAFPVSPELHSYL